MPKAIWNGAVIAESDITESVEGNHYFPATSLNQAYLQASTKETVCPWKGTASYFDIVVDGQVNAAAAWTYKTPKEKASHIKDHVAFWNGVKIED